MSQENFELSNVDESVEVSKVSEDNAGRLSWSF